MSMSTKRFIAGAVCPRCGEMDRLITYTKDDDTFKECVSCDFEEKQVVQLEQDEVGTRVNHMSEAVSSDSAEENTTQVINIINPLK